MILRSVIRIVLAAVVVTLKMEKCPMQPIFQPKDPL
jgi:hypothetical protein